jgi:hypothetical protein
MVRMEPDEPEDHGHLQYRSGAAGWGHTALIAEQSGRTKLFLCGRPHDFQTLMRLRRLPSSLRRLGLSANSATRDSNDPSVMQRIVSYLAGENEVTTHEEECRRYSSINRLLPMELPDGQDPAVEDEVVDEALLTMHGRAKMIPHSQGNHTEDDNNCHFTKGIDIYQPYHTHFQNTLSASAGLTAVISKTGKLYTFGLNHRGQCGVGSFSPNVWTPTPVLGLASLRFILDYTASQEDKDDNPNNSGSHVYKECTEQEYPMIGVSLGLQHGLALDCMGQIFSWGKGERGQLGLGKRYRHESETNDGEPYENKTLEYAMQITNFYDPYATTTDTQDIYAPLLSTNDSRIRLIGAGMNFSLAVTESNLPYIWGKNCIPNPQYDPNGMMNIRAKSVLDSTYPRFIQGLPPTTKIVKVACGTHHAAMLLEDGSIYAVGVATDQPIPMWTSAVQILPPHVVDVSSLISLTAGFDRTFVVFDESGSRQTIEIQLWSQEEMRLNGSVRPSWVDWFEEQREVRHASDTMEKVKSVHRGWMHTVVITE